MKKRTIALILVLVMAFAALSASASADNKKVKIQFMHQEVEQERQEVIAKIIEEFQAQYPDITVVQMPTNEDDYDTKITTLGGSGQLPAVIQFSQDQAKTCAANDFLDFDAMQEVIDEKGMDEFFSGALTALKTEDGANYVGVPVNGWVQGIWCNTNMLKEKGFDVPQNWEEVLKIAEAFYNPAAKQYGIALPTSESAFTEQVFSQFALSNGANVFDADGNVTVNTPAMKEAAEYYKKLASYSMPGSTEVADVRDAFVNQNAPMCMYSTYILKRTIDAGFINAVALATPKNTEAAAYGCIYAFSIAADLDDAEREAAKTFVSFMLEKEHNEEWLLMAPGGVQPILAEVANDSAYTSNEAIVPMAHLLGEVGEAFNNLQMFGSVDGKNFMVMGDITNSGVLSKMMNNIIVQNADIDKELAQAQAKVEALL